MKNDKTESSIGLRMGTADIQILDEFVAGHPELGGRSNIIRTAVLEYINRDARSTPSDKKGIFVPLSEKTMITLQIIREKEGLHDTEAEFVEYHLKRILDPKDGPYAEDFAEARKQCDLTL